MKTTHRTISLAGHTLHCIDFLPASFSAADLLWLPHHAAVLQAGRKRQAEHLAGRIAAVHALGELGITSVPAIGAQGQPCWPQGLSGSISHSENRAIAVVARQSIGVDIETRLSEAICVELTDSIVDRNELALLKNSPLPFPLALTLAFSAKESLFKAFSRLAHPLPGFASAQVVAINNQCMELRLSSSFSSLLAGKKAVIHWQVGQQQIITLCTGIICKP